MASLAESASWGITRINTNVKQDANYTTAPQKKDKMQRWFRFRHLSREVWLETSNEKVVFLYFSRIPPESEAEVNKIPRHTCKLRSV